MYLIHGAFLLSVVYENRQITLLSID